ncbi:MAG: hypothetical protein AAF683_02265 [Pseudomonadota bacterium]
MSIEPQQPETEAMQDELTVWTAAKDLGFISWLFAAVVGAPSVLSLTQIVFVDFSPTELLQWLLDGYNDLLSVLTAILSPIATVAVAFIEGIIEVPLELSRHWQPLFVLLVIFISSNTRALLDDGYPKPAIVFAITMVIAAFGGALSAGVIPPEGPWWLQGMAVGVPVLAMFTGMFVAYGIAAAALDFNQPYRKPLLAYLKRGVVLGLAAFVVAGTISLTGLIDTHAGLLTLFIGMAVYGAYWLRAGFADGDVPEIRFGLRLVGGFVFAIVIVALDAGLGLIT